MLRRTAGEVDAFLSAAAVQSIPRSPRSAAVRALISQKEIRLISPGSPKQNPTRRARATANFDGRNRNSGDDFHLITG